MDEKHYRQTYQQINHQRCIFEKSLQTQVSGCSKSHRFCLADREGIACTHKPSHDRCKSLYDLLHHNANFALGITKVDSALPHNQEIKIQNGGLHGVQQALLATRRTSQKIEDISILISEAVKKFKTLDDLPFDQVVKYIVSYAVKKRRRTT